VRSGDARDGTRLAVVLSTGDVIWTIDAETGCFTFLRPSIERMPGYMPDKMIGRPVADDLSPASLARRRRQRMYPDPQPEALGRWQQVRAFFASFTTARAALVAWL